ncbi:MAG: penicillin-binding protein 2 [Synergistaceae bacterium]|nr:penicillin-binding protein 2 [Synergistaceae bacterium]MBQ6001492.1 penicillin-binding protein 2 [Synergistaceae bacterium]MBQ6982856.1 penicillin-binding protein 2 [Synergistaceae bacterium]MBR0247531.1 penicillin-binding protein 2 [Synergistaceae bacterium]
MTPARQGRAGNPWILFVIFFVVIGCTLAARHCYPDPRIVQQSQHQYWRRVPVKSTRGIIQDVKGNALVISETLPSFAIDPSMIKSKDLEEIAQVVSPDTMVKITSAMGKKTRFLWINHKVQDREAAKFLTLMQKVRAVLKVDEPYRKYTNQNLMSHVLGFCDNENRGQAGIEQAWDNTLYNPPGQKIVVRRQNSQAASLMEREPERRAVTPIVTLTLDSRIQYVVEKHLFRTAEHERAKWAVAICMNPMTGEILAMASYPTYDPSNRKSLTMEALSNGAVSRTYEPGSTFKPVYMAVALERGWVRKDEMFFCPAKLKVADGFIRESDARVALGNVNTAQLLIKSSNVGMAQIGIRADKLKTYESLQALGFGKETDVELPGVSRGILPYPENWRGITPANIAIGQGLAVTPIQLVTAMAAVVNGGKLMSPYIVKEAVNSLGELVYRGEPKVMREVMTADTAQWIRQAMRRVILEGTGKRAATTITNVAGKTGTAQVAGKGGYLPGKYVASFIGFWPYEDPKYLMLIAIGEPSNGRYYGGELAAPVFKSIVEEMAELEYYS